MDERQDQENGNRGHRATDHHVNGHHGGKNAMSRFANVVTIEVAPGRRDQIVTLLAAHKERLKDEPGTLQFEVLLPKDDDTKVLSFEMYRDAAAFEVHLNGPSLAQLREETAGMVMKLQGVRCAVVD
jgi:quinol monooxygenase YgiN